MRKDVTVVNLADLEMEDVRRGRVHMIRRKRLPLESGVLGVTLEFSYSIVPEGYFTPRHRHNFDQIRYTLSGLQSTGYGDLGPGEVGYFPEGVHYGPQKQDGECHCLVLQYQGASGLHLLSNEEMNETYNKLKAAGAVFEDGIYKGVDKNGKRVNKDSYKAIWEEHEGAELKFPAGRYRDPVMMEPKNYRWVVDRKRPGVETKHLGTFTERCTGIGFFRLAPGASMPAERQDEAEIRYLVEGSVNYGGKTWNENTYFFIPPGADVGALNSTTGGTFFTISLPMIAQLAVEKAGEGSRAAAE